MKLILPRERISLQQKEQERLVFEETAISARVDELRKLEASELKKLQDFQEKEFLRFSEEKERREEQLRNLDELILRKNKEIESFFGPLEEKWALFKQVEKSKIEEEQRKQLETAADLFLKEKEQEAKGEEQAKKALVLKKEQVEIIALSQKIEEDKKDSLKESAAIRQQASDLYSEAEQAKKDAKILENEAADALKESEIRTELLNRREKDLERRETQVLIKELQYYSPVQPLAIKK